MSVNRILSIGLLSMVIGLAPSSRAADMADPGSIPEPILAEKGIWGAIAYSTTDNRHGFFWGADKRDEAENIALKYCKNAEGKTARSLRFFAIIVTGMMMTVPAFPMSIAPPCP